MKYLFNLVLCIVLYTSSGVCEAAFESVNNSQLPGMSIGAIKSYGEFTVREELFASLKDSLRESMQYSKKLNLTEDFDGFLNIKGYQVPVNEFLNIVLIDAIARGKECSYNSAGPNVRQYVKAKGIKLDANNSSVYQLSPEYHNSLQMLKSNNDSRYILLCNIKDADFVTSKVSLKDKKVSLEVDYYLLDIDLNKVYEGHIDSTKQSGLIISLGYFNLKKNIEAPQLFQKIFTQVAKRLVDDIDSKAFPALKGGVIKNG